MSEAIIVEDKVSTFSRGQERYRLVSYKHHNFHCSSKNEVNNALGIIHGKYGHKIQVIFK